MYVLNYTWKMSPVARGAMFVSKMDVVEVVTGAISPNLLAFMLVVVTAVVFIDVSSIMSDVVGTCWCFQTFQVRIRNLIRYTDRDVKKNSIHPFVHNYA